MGAWDVIWEALSLYLLRTPVTFKYYKCQHRAVVLLQ